MIDNPKKTISDEQPIRTQTTFERTIRPPKIKINEDRRKWSSEIVHNLSLSKRWDANSANKNVFLANRAKTLGYASC
jgi:hypothetical protein